MSQTRIYAVTAAHVSKRLRAAVATQEQLVRLLDEDTPVEDCRAATKAAQS